MTWLSSVPQLTITLHKHDTNMAPSTPWVMIINDIHAIRKQQNEGRACNGVLHVHKINRYGKDQQFINGKCN